MRLNGKNGSPPRLARFRGGALALALGRWVTGRVETSIADMGLLLARLARLLVDAGRLLELCCNELFDLRRDAGASVDLADTVEEIGLLAAEHR